MLAPLLAEACSRVLRAPLQDAGSLRAHAGKVLRIRMGSAAAAVRVRSDGSFEGVHPSIDPQAEVEVPLKRLLDAQASVSAQGDADFLEACKSALAQADIAPDALAERWLGPQAGAAAARAAGCAGSWGADARARLSDSFGSWLTHESSLVPDPAEVRAHELKVKDFARRVERLRRAAAGRGGSAREEG